MATSLRLVILLCAAAAVLAQHVKTNFLDEAQALSHNVEQRATNKDQSVIYGVQGSNDRILYHEFVDVSKGIFKTKKKDITYPLEATPNDPIITCMKVQDYLRTGKNAEFKVSSGGLGQKYAIINMKSQRGEPIKYDVSIYGR